MKCLLSLFLLSSLAYAEDKALPEPKAEVEERKDLFNLTYYKPVYFVYNPHSSKLQASFKYRLVRDYNLYFAYTHLILWDWHGESRPFFDVNYNPEFFYRWEFKKKYLESIDLIPYGHTSNGRESEDSRSLDYIAVQMNFKSYVLRNLAIRSGIKLKHRYGFDSTNSEIEDYEGPLEVNLAATGFTRGFIDKGEITLKFIPGGKFANDFTKGSQEIGFSFRMMGFNITPEFYMQYFRGYNESLRYFRETENIFRVGLKL